MADRSNHGTDSPDRKSHTAAATRTNPKSLFNRSITFSPSSSTPPPAAAVPGKAVYGLCDAPTLHRAGSIKSLYSSPFVSMVSAGHSLRGKVRKLCSIFESPKYPPIPQPSAAAKLLPRIEPPIPIPKSVPDSPFRLPGTEDRVVIYFTSLRGIRRTFQDCHSTRMTFRGLRVNVDERDISMDAAYRKELQRVLGESHVSLPQVFIKGKYVGGADVIRQLVEAGELERLTRGLPARAPLPCDGCGDVRFVPCANCSGSRKVFDEEEEQPKRCAECNENGLVRCPLCCES